MEKKQIYKCEICGNIVELIHVGGGDLVCCGEKMKLMQEKTEDSSVEKHVPFIIKEKGKITVKVGQNAAHPMEDKHYIEWIEINADGESYKKFLSPGDKPEAVFLIDAEVVYAREYCNVHGLWKG